MRVLSYLFFVSLFFMAIPSEAAVINNLRSGAYTDKTRIVLDLDELPKYSEALSGSQLSINLDADVKQDKVLTPRSDLVKKVFLRKDAHGKAKLSVDLAENLGSYKIFVLKAPNRLVIDFYKYVISKKITEIDDGMRYISWRDYLNSKPVWLHILEVAPKSRYELRPILGKSNTIDKGRLSAAAEQTGALAAINASYFDKTKWIVGNLKINNEWVSCDFTPRTALVIDRSGKTEILPDLYYDGQVLTEKGKTAAITGINRERKENDLILYNFFYGQNTGTNKFGREVRIEKGKVTEIGVNGNLVLRPGSLVLSGHGRSAEFLKNLKVGSRVEIKQTLEKKEADKAKYVIGAGPLLVSNGKADVTAVKEQFPADIAVGRAPRTAVGLKADGSILLVVAEGRSKVSAGLTLNELADYMVKLGAKEAMNFDGGGSSEMVLNKKVMNTPSDGSERPVRAGLGVFRN
ncbi:MAG: phosphodiester glycosidase family protein [Acidaminococcaceae bacterium]